MRPCLSRRLEACQNTITFEYRASYHLFGNAEVAKPELFKCTLLCLLRLAPAAFSPVCNPGSSQSWQPEIGPVHARFKTSMHPRSSPETAGADFERNSDADPAPCIEGSSSSLALHFTKLHDTPSSFDEFAEWPRASSPGAPEPAARTEASGTNSVFLL